MPGLTAQRLLKSAYEIARDTNIAANNEMLRSLGLLGPAKGEGKSALGQKRIRTRTAGGSEGAASAPANKKSKKTEPSRVSRRQKGNAPEIEVYGIADPLRRNDIEQEGMDDEMYNALQAARAQAKKTRYERLLTRHQEEGLELPARASYRHTIMRVKSMSEKALENRVKAIERAAGIYAVIKMQMFAEVLILEGYEEVATLAQAALDNLLQLPKFKDKDWAQMLEMAKGMAFKK
jgi:hypothetical protein